MELLNCGLDTFCLAVPWSAMLARVLESLPVVWLHHGCDRPRNARLNTNEIAGSDDDVAVKIETGAFAEDDH
jgi:hypothetical protein